MIDSINALPGHKQKFIELFKTIEKILPHESFSKSLDEVGNPRPSQATGTKPTTTITG